MYDTYRDKLNDLAVELEEIKEENKKLKEIIDKAIEYIKKNYIYMPTSSSNNYVDTDKLLEILKGENNE